MRLLKSILGLTKNPDNTDNAFFIVDSTLKALSEDEIQKYSAMVLAYPGFKELYPATDTLALYDTEALSRLPGNTLGYLYVKFVRDHKYTVDWFPRMENSTPIHFARNRLFQTHDILHTVTGFNGSPFGETGLQAFYTGQLPLLPLPSATMAAAFLRVLDTTGNEKTELMEHITAGYEMGKHAKPVLFTKWEDYWEADIGELRARLGIQAFSLKTEIPATVFSLRPLALAQN